jgi:hypothetical protein
MFVYLFELNWYKIKIYLFNNQYNYTKVTVIYKLNSYLIKSDYYAAGLNNSIFIMNTIQLNKVKFTGNLQN